MVLMSGNAPESHANLAIKLFIKQPAVFQLHEEIGAQIWNLPRTYSFEDYRDNNFTIRANGQAVGLCTQTVFFTGKDATITSRA